MINDLNLWIRQIIIIVIFAAFIDFLIPSGGFKRYTKALLGLVIMITILNPLLVLLNKNYILEEVIWKYQDLIDDNEIAAMAEDFDTKNQQLIVNEYKKRITDHIAQTIAENSSFEAQKIDVKINENKEDDKFGKIDELHIWLKDNSKEQKLENVGKVNVTITGELSERFSNGTKYEEQQIFSLKKYLSEAFDVNINEIYFY